MTMITPSYLGETIEYSSLHACRSTLEDPTVHRRFLGRSSQGIYRFNLRFQIHLAVGHETLRIKKIFGLT